MSRPEDQREQEESGYGAAEEDVTEDTPSQEQPERPEHEASDTRAAMQNETAEADDSVAVPEAD